MKTRKLKGEKEIVQQGNSGCCNSTSSQSACCEQPTDGSSCCDKEKSKDVNSEETGCC